MGSLGLALYYMEELLKLLEPLFYMEESSLGGGWEVVGRWLGGGWERGWERGWEPWLGALVGSPGWERMYYTEASLMLLELLYYTEESL